MVAHSPAHQAQGALLEVRQACHQSSGLLGGHAALSLSAAPPHGSWRDRASHRKGAGTRDFFATAYGEHEGKFDGFKFGDANVQFDDTLLLIEPEAARHECKLWANRASRQYAQPNATASLGKAARLPTCIQGKPPPPSGHTPPSPAAMRELPPFRPRLGSFHWLRHSLSPQAAAKMRLVAEIAEEIIANTYRRIQMPRLMSASRSRPATPTAAQDQTKRAVAENAKTLGFNTAEWE